MPPVGRGERLDQSRRRTLTSGAGLSIQRKARMRPARASPGRKRFEKSRRATATEDEAPVEGVDGRRRAETNSEPG